jgi:hypothetical protein
MRDVPNVVLKRLQKKAALESHPDADLLTALAEQSLPPNERTQLMEHLAQCAECREVVALSLPANEIQPTVNPVAEPRGWSWFAWPIVRYTFATAGVLAIALFGFVQYRQHRLNDQMLVSKLNQGDSPKMAPAAENAGTTTRIQNPPAPMPPDSQVSITASPEDAPNLRMPGNHGRVRATPSNRNAFRSPLTVDSAANSVLAAGSGSGIGSGSGGGMAAGSYRSDSGARGGESGAGQVSESSAIEVTAQNQASDQLVENQGKQASVINSDVVKAKAATAPSQAVPPSQNAAAALAASEAASQQTAQSLTAPAFPLWTISSTGTLQRSFDAGETWQDVSPNAGGIGGGLLAKKATNIGTSSEKLRKEKPQSAPVFRAVTAIGPEVWVGGSDATLYHSSDSGAGWEQVSFSLAGGSPGSGSPTGDVTTIEFSDSQHGRFSTSTGQVWLTSDSGQTWRKQQ